MGLCLLNDLSPAARAAWLTGEEARPEDAGRLSVRVCFGLQLWGATGCQNVVASCGSNVVSSHGCEVATKEFTNFMQKK